MNDEHGLAGNMGSPRKEFDSDGQGRFKHTFSSLHDDAIWDDPAHLRGEILTEVQLLEHARQLARSHGIPTTRGSALPLKRRFRETRRLIQKAYVVLAQGVERKRDPSPAELWLLDNSHVVEAQLREIEEDLPWGYLIELPRRDSGRMRGYPLVYGLCVDYLRHTDCHVDIESLSRYVDAYQSERILTIGELWAVPIMLRLGLVLTVGAIVTSEASPGDRDLSEAWAKRLLWPTSASADPEARERKRREVQEALAELERWDRKEPPSDAFLVTLLRRLREREDSPVAALEWISTQTERLNSTPDELTRRHLLRQAADQISVGNAITSMRSVNALDWSSFFSRVSRVEEVLRHDPSGAYPDMDVGSRDRCRHAVEKLARRSRHSEVVVAQAALELARAEPPEREPFRAHVGYYLLDAGRPELFRALSYHPRLDLRLGEMLGKHPAVPYLLTIALLTLLLANAAWAGLTEVDAPLWVRSLLVPAFLFAASEIAVAIVNAAVVTILPPRILPKLEFKAGIPEQYPTLVVVPTLLDHHAGLNRLLDELEVRSLANNDENLFFALLTDFRDADEATKPEDAALLEKALAGISALNARNSKQRFFLLHRRRTFNQYERVYMGWERKRGKLHELNRLLRGANDTNFEVVTAPSDLLQRIRYVITLDTDTELPLGVARRLVATIAHPLNRPWIDERTQRVYRGHALIQPRVGTSPMSARRSVYARLAAGPPGIDPYTTAVSDVYQDLFREGSFVGKGIYDVDAFHQVMEGRVPENQLLSHDLFESIYARAALASDIEVLDEQPTTYPVAADRQHRWTRGDWQLVPWLFPRVPGEKWSRRYDFRVFDLWRILDNLRRSLLAPALVVMTACTWLSGSESAAVGTLLLLSVFVVPVIGRLAFAFARSDSQLEWLGGLGGDLKSNTQQAVLSLTFLLDQALVSTDAVFRACYRQWISRRHMLDWASMRDASSRSQNSIFATPRILGAGALSVLLAAGILLLAPAALKFAGPILVLWALAPWVSVWVSRTQPQGVFEPWGEKETACFGVVSRKTWRFFEQFVGERDHYLPPDNFQEEPRGIVAHRTSPTNIGLYLLSVSAARDLGYVTIDEAVRRMDETLTTIESLEKREGHVLNWYDTTTLAPLEPRYVSTVDSGNLAGYLWTLAGSCRDAKQERILSDRALCAAREAAELALTALRSENAPQEESSLLSNIVDDLERLESARHTEPFRIFSLLTEAARSATALSSAATEFANRESDGWRRTLRRGLERGLQQVEQRLPHITLWQSWGELAKEKLDEAARRSLDRLLYETASPERLVTEFDEIVEAARPLLSKLHPTACREFEECLGAAAKYAAQLIVQLDEVIGRAEGLVEEMDFRFLYDESRSLFYIGYNVSSARFDNSHYDLLASEARLASLIAIAKGDVPSKHWFRLGRLRAKYASNPGLMSWSGSMFEYFMPLLVTRSYPDTLLDQTYHAVIESQIEYARGYSVPWGISEAAYNVMDLQLNYQYRAFGVPELGLKPGLGEDLVVAPYATALAALVRPRAAAENFEKLREAGFDGRFGFYESADYTPSRLPPKRNKVVVKAFMAHHQGMTLVALSNLLCDFAMQRRFHSDPRIKACALLLEERIPARAGVVLPQTPRVRPALAQGVEYDAVEHLDAAEVRDGAPRGHLMGQGPLSAFITSGGEGFLTWRGIDVQRFREESSLECGGIYLYFRDLDEELVWSSGYLPTRGMPKSYDVLYSVDKVEIARRDRDLETVTEITLSPDHPAEVRRITLKNHAERPARIEVTTFTELCLAQRMADVAHPAFQKLFIQTEFLESHGALIAHRRKRSRHDQDIWVAQLFIGVDGGSPLGFGNCRSSFLGRGGSTQSPRQIAQELTMSGEGTLDPALVLRRQIHLEPGGQIKFSFVTLLAESRENLLAEIEQFSDTQSVERAFDLAWADSRVEMRHLGINSLRVHRYQRLLSALMFPQPLLRGEPNVPAGTRGRDALWSQGISGDLPILILRLDDPEFSDLCRDLILAHEFWRLNGLSTDLVILNEEPSSYLQPVQDQVQSLIRSTPAEGHVDQRGGVFVRRSSLIAEEDLQLILSAARIVLRASLGSLARQLRPLTRLKEKALHRGERGWSNPPASTPSAPPGSVAKGSVSQRPQDGAGAAQRSLPHLQFENGVGGFDAESGEYVMTIRPGHRPPQPWSNVMAGPRFGSLVTESGASFSWYENSQKHRLTPWSNDPCLDPSGECLYVRDLDSKSSWSLTPGPKGAEADYQVAHGQGYSRFIHERTGLVQELTISVDPDDPVKIMHVALHNSADRPRRLRMYAYVEWVLGNHRESLRVSTITHSRKDLRAIVARNPFSPFPGSRAFLVSTQEVGSLSTDRQEFFGNFGSRAEPVALRKTELSGRSGAGLDPCGVLEVEITVGPRQRTQLAFALGAGQDERESLELIGRYGQLSEAEASLVRTRAQWQGLLGRIRVKTPDPAFDLLNNHWLPYQVLSCRFWGRSAFFQSGGAYGYRDQLQDAMALLFLRPQLAREHILLSASRQFLEGDVQHWWHPDTGEGVRTHCSDDLVWLPWAALEYCEGTNDFALFDEQVNFLQERLLEASSDDLYSVPPVAAESASLYEHCVRALDAATTQGPHGLPLIKAGDWNDGMNRVGEGGKGESVWLAWFLAHVLDRFARIAKRRGDVPRAEWCQKEAARLGAAVDASMWDGKWYRRATFDDGSPVGSAQNDECRIDAIAQAWATISGVGDKERAVLALDSSLEHLWRRDEKMMLLLTPPFSGRDPDPGYIGAYPPGVRENGGQYSHGVLWTALALLLEGRGKDAYEFLADLNPIRHSTSPADLAKYQVEPYVLAADVYSEPPHVGRGGWTWYTGSASWMYRISIEWMLGIKRRGQSLTIDPCVSPEWTDYEVVYTTEEGGRLVMHFINPERVSRGVVSLMLDGVPLAGVLVPLPKGAEQSRLEVRLGKAKVRALESGSVELRPLPRPLSK